MDNLENQPEESAKKPQNPAPESAAPSTTSSRKRKLWWTSVIIIIVAIIIIIAIFSVNNKNSALTESQTPHVDTQLTEFQQNIQQMHAQINTLEQNIASLQKSDAAHSEAIQLAVDTSQRLQAELTGKQNGWLIDEALYLTRLANYSLNFQNNPETSVLLLQNADDALFRTGSANVMSARHVLAQDITALQAISTVDVSGVYLQLQVLNEQFNKLPVVDEMMIKTPEKHTDNVNTHWQDNLTNNLKHLSGIVVIQHRDKPIYPLLTQEEYTTLTIYLTLLSSHAQWALLHRSQPVYQDSLNQMSAIISTYYANNNDITKKILEKITALNKINVAPPYPNINNAVDALNQLSTSMNNKIKLGEKAS